MPKLNKEKIKQILEDRFKNDIHRELKTIPKPNVFKDMNKAAKRIASAIKNKEKIALVGDYDVDGIISSVIMDEFFTNIGSNIEIKIPNRFTDGYGINENLVKELDASVIITVDNGILAYEAASICKDLGIDLIISDHHMPAEILPDAYAIINPKRSDCDFSLHANCEICGAQVAWWLCGAIKQELKIDYNLATFLDLLCIAIVADMMPLNDLNHLLVRHGIKEINKLNRPAFKALKNRYKKRFFDYESIPFLIAPLLNASGRMCDASLSYDFLKSSNLAQANEKLDEIERLNSERKEEEKRCYNESLSQVYESDNAIVVYANHWHKGILGIVAGRLAKDFNKPSFVFSIEGELAKGSARSVQGLDILSLLMQCEDVLNGFGGHKGAAGLSVKTKMLDDFKKLLNTKIQNMKTNDEIDEALGELDFCEINMQLLDLIDSFEPFGHGNQKPYFYSKNIVIKKPQILKNKHLKCTLVQDEIEFDAIYFNSNLHYEDGEKVKIDYYLRKNYFKINPTIQLNILKIHK